MNSSEQSDQPSPEAYREAARALLRDFEIDAGRVREQRRTRAIAFLVLVGAAVTLKMSVDAIGYRDGKELRLMGERAFLTTAVVGFSAFLAGIFAAILGLWALVVRGIQERRFGWPYLMGIGALVAAFWFRPFGYSDGLWARLLPADDAAYVAFGRQTRALMESRKVDMIFLGSAQLNPDVKPDEKRNAADFSKILKSSTLADWPEELTWVSVDEVSVWLKRGSGMTGDIGIRIFDKLPAAEFRPKGVPRDNPYVPEEYSLSERVVFTSSR